MSHPPSHRWYFPWVPLGLLAGVAVGVGVLLMGTFPSQQAKGAPAQAQPTAGFQHQDRLVLTINLPPAPEGKSRGQLTLELLSAEGKSLHRVSRDVTLSALGSSERIELPALVSPDKVNVRCTLDQKQVEVPLQR